MNHAGAHSLIQAQPPIPERQAAILDALPAHVALLDPDGRITAVNRMWRHFAGAQGLGLTDAGIGANYLAACQTAAAQGDPSATSALAGLRDILTGRSERLELTYPCRLTDGSERWYQLVAVPFAEYDNDAPQRHGALVMHHDITQCIRAEQQMRRSETCLRLILDAVPDAMVTTDEHGTIRDFSPAAEHMFGWPAKEAIGQDVSILLPSTDRAAHARHVECRAEADEAHIAGVNRVTTGQRRNGSTFPIQLSIASAHLDGQRRFTGFIRDLTGQEETKVHLRELQTELLHLSRLSAAGVMASALAHELHQPLTATATSVSAARRMLARLPTTDTMPALEAALDLAAEQTMLAGQIVRGLREFLARGGESEKTVEYLGGVISESCAIALAGTKELGVHVTVDVPPDMPPVLADRVQTQQVLFNLLRNAVQAMTDQDPRVRPATLRHYDLRVSARPIADGMAEIAVADTGPGLAPEIANRLFEPFVTTKRSGMGVGLAICRSIVEAHRGRLWVENNPGGGTVFRFTLPMMPSDPVSDEEVGLGRNPWGCAHSASGVLDATP